MLIRRSQNQGICHDHRSGKEYQLSIVEDARQYLGGQRSIPVEWCHWTANRNAEFYLLWSGSRRWLLKILTTKPVATLQCEYASLRYLYQIGNECGVFRVPEPVLEFPGKSAYLMNYEEGLRLDRHIMGRANPSVELTGLLTRVGSALAAIHRAWSTGVGGFDAEAAHDDFDHLPWEPTQAERRILRSALSAVDGAPVPTARLYLDFDPVNLLLGPNDSIILLDPPELEVTENVHWDLGIFTFGVRRAGWRNPIRGIRRGTHIGTLTDAFMAGYVARRGFGLSIEEEILTAIAEVTRIAQLWAWWLAPFEFRDRATGIARAVYAYPLLLRARREQFRKLAALTGSAC